MWSHAVISCGGLDGTHSSTQDQLVCPDWRGHCASPSCVQLARLRLSAGALGLRPQHHAAIPRKRGPTPTLSDVLHCERQQCLLAGQQPVAVHCRVRAAEVLAAGQAGEEVGGAIVQLVTDDPDAG
jgi:hypothetical protein